MVDLKLRAFGRWTAAIAAALVVAVPAAQAEVTFLDHRGKLIELEAPPQRIVSMFASGPLVHYAIEGHSDRIVGVQQEGQGMYESSIYGQLIPEFLKLKSNVAGEGFVPNVEAILEIKPDAVLQWTFDPKIIEPLERVGLKVMGWDCCTNQHRREYLHLERLHVRPQRPRPGDPAEAGRLQQGAARDLRQAQRRRLQEPCCPSTRSATASGSSPTARRTTA